MAGCGSPGFATQNTKSLRIWPLGIENPEIHDAGTASGGKIVNGIGFYGV